MKNIIIAVVFCILFGTVCAACTKYSATDASTQTYELKSSLDSGCPSDAK